VKPLQVACVVTLLVAATVGCESSSRDVTAPLGAAPSPSAARPTSIVQLGDSIASGEGTLYGYTYDTTTQEWMGGNLDATWPPPYPQCHDSPDAYGNVVASYFGAAFHQYACTGATFADGISAIQTDGDTTLRPAQFGNWASQTALNADYDAAKPDLVLVTLGADDLQFVAIVEACIENGYDYAFGLADLECVDGNPGATIQTDYVDFLPTLKANYATLVDWIEARAKANNVAMPKIVFTNYANPLPADGQKCPDTNWLYPKQTAYLSSLVSQLDGIIKDTIEGLGNDAVAFADISQAYQPNEVSHIWCTSAPWAYGLSIYHVSDPYSFESQAPFHPTPRGQKSIAEHVIPTVRQVFPGATATPTTTGP
jgi:lysophospholipase L1-like esterase